MKVKVGTRKKIPQTRCPRCSTPFGFVYNIGGKDYLPREGVIVICTECGHVMALGKKLEPRALNKKQMREVAKRIVR